METILGALRPANKLTVMLPNFFIPGAAKCGSSALNFYLSQHPQFAMARPKEPPFFSAQYEQGLRFYETTYFSHWKGERFVGDAAHRNLYLPYVPNRILHSIPHAKFIVLLRNPVERAYSHYWHDFTHNVRDLSFEDCLELDLCRMEQGCKFETPESYLSVLDDTFEMPNHPTLLDTAHYAEQIQHYWDLFGRDSMHIALFEDLASDTIRVLDSIVAFLGGPL